MILVNILLTALICELIVLLGFDWVNGWQDFWIIIVTFIVGIFIGILLFALFVSVLALFIRLDKELDKPKKLYHRILKRFCEMLLQISRVKVMVRGLEKIPEDKKFLAISNHQSMYDAVAVFWTLRAFQISFILKNSLYKIPIANKFMHAGWFFGLDRDNPREGIKVIKKSYEAIANDISSIAICPEGTRSGGYELGEFKSGSFKIALKAKCPIVVIAVQNSNQVMKRFPWKSTKLFIDIVDVIEYSSFENMSTQEISDKCYEVLKEGLAELPRYDREGEI